jgi:hypothetical protein
MPVVDEAREELPHVQDYRFAFGQDVLPGHELGILVRAFIEKHPYPAETAAIQDVPPAVIVPIADERRRLVTSPDGRVNGKGLLTLETRPAAASGLQFVEENVCRRYSRR